MYKFVMEGLQTVTAACTMFLLHFWLSNLANIGGHYYRLAFTVL